MVKGIEILYDYYYGSNHAITKHTTTCSHTSTLTMQGLTVRALLTKPSCMTESSISESPLLFPPGS